MTVREKLEKAKFLIDSIKEAYEDDKTTGEYQDSKQAGRLIKEVLKTIG